MRPKIAFAVVLLSVLAHADSVLNRGSALVKGMLVKISVELDSEPQLHEQQF